MTNTKNTVDYLAMVAFAKRVVERSCVPVAMGEAVGVRPDPMALLERNRDILKGSSRQLSIRMNLIQCGMEAREIVQMEGPVPELENDIGKISQFIGRIRKSDTPLGKGLREHKFEFVVTTGKEVGQIVDSGAKFLVVGENENGLLHMTCLGQGGDESPILTSDEVIGWKVTPREKK